MLERNYLKHLRFVNKPDSKNLIFRDSHDNTYDIVLNYFETQHMLRCLNGNSEFRAYINDLTVLALFHNLGVNFMTLSMMSNKKVSGQIDHLIFDGPTIAKFLDNLMDDFRDHEVPQGVIAEAVRKVKPHITMVYSDSAIKALNKDRDNINDAGFRECVERTKRIATNSSYGNEVEVHIFIDQFTQQTGSPVPSFGFTVYDRESKTPVFNGGFIPHKNTSDGIWKYHRHS